MQIVNLIFTRRKFESKAAQIVNLSFTSCFLILFDSRGYDHPSFSPDFFFFFCRSKDYFFGLKKATLQTDALAKCLPTAAATTNIFRNICGNCVLE